MSQTVNRLTKQEISVLIRKFFAFLNVEIVKFNLRPFSEEKLGYLGVHEQLTVEAKAGEERRLFTFFVKSGSLTATEFDALITREESRFFGDVVPKMMEGTHIQSWAAECYLAKEDLLVLDDLRAKGFKIVTDLREKQLRSAVTCLARFHAASILLEYRLNRSLDEVYADSFKNKVFVNDNGLAWKWLVAGVEVIEAVARNLGLDTSHIMTAYQSTLKKVEPLKSERNVFCHADLWSNNIMFSMDDEDCRLVDFQMVTYAPYAIDLVQLLYLNASREVRQRMERDLIQLYHSTLTSVLVENGLDKTRTVRLEQVLRDVEGMRICGLVTAVQYFPLSCLNKQASDEYSKDVDRLKGYMYISRKNFILGIMQRDQKYKTRIEEAVRELIEFMEQ